jgi:acetyl-CoA/propionyl-CoA carboxylase biotin carboxyl carrier protein
MFEIVLVANRGEIAVRVIRTLRTLGIRSVAVYSDPDAAASHVRAADAAVRIGPAPARDSYLCIDRVIEAARASGAEAIHPGYGFLSESAHFARACAAAGLTFVGPRPETVEIMGDKISAKRAVVAAGVAVVPGRFEPGMTDDELARAAAQVGYPVLVKPAFGGGGKGMRLVRDPGVLASELVSARREALSAFGDDTLFVERFVASARHIEVQVLADAHGNVIALGERECSLQRRHQKIVEEAPSVLLDPPTRARIGAAAVEIARSVGYLGVGTVEFIVSAEAPEEFFFMEMNTRLQVEHPVTELVTGLDLVAQQLRVAAGEPLTLTQDDVRLRGHAIEARLYAEDPARGFLPTGGTVLALREPGGELDGEPGIRVDSGISVGTEIGTWYDPMLSKVIAWGPDRPVALARLQRALAGTAVLGVGTNLGFLRSLLAHPEVVAGRLDTALVDRELPALLGARPRPVPDQVLAVYGLVRLLELEPPGPSANLWAIPSGWRIGADRPLLRRVVRPDSPDSSDSSGSSESVEVRVCGTTDAATVSVDGGPWLRASIVRDGEPGELRVSLDGVSRRWLHAVQPDAAQDLQPDAGWNTERDRTWLESDGETWVLCEVAARTRERAALGAVGDVRSPMPGVVLAVHVAEGDVVRAGQPLVVVEAMKMEHAVTAAGDGQVHKLLVRVGDRVALDQLLAALS